MNRIQLIDILEKNNIPPSRFSTKGVKEDAICIIEKGSEFELAYFEKGNKTSFGMYSSEKLICQVMLKKLGVTE